MTPVKPLWLSAALLLGACAHQGPRPAEVRRLIAPALTAHAECHRLAHGDLADLRAAGVTLEGGRLPNGRLVFPDRPGSSEESIRRAYDLLAELGLFTVEDQPLRPPGRLRRHYAPTPVGATHVRTIVPGHGQGWQGLCYGARALVALDELGALNRVSPCEATRVVTYRYRLEAVPAWTDDPRLAEIFPELVTRRGAAEIRRDSAVIVRRRGHWYFDSGDPLVRPVCLSR